MKLAKVAYKPAGLVLGVVSGVVARMVFRKVWDAVGDGEDAPDPMDERREWRELLLAAALQGAIFAVVRAAVNRGGAVAARRVTGVWPG